MGEQTERLLAALNCAGIGAKPANGIYNEKTIPVGHRDALMLDSADDIAAAITILSREMSADDMPAREKALLDLLRGITPKQSDLSSLTDDVPRCAIVFTSRDDTASLARALGELFAPDGQDVVVGTARGEYTLIKCVKDVQPGDLLELCLALEDTVRAESGMQVTVGIGDARPSLSLIAESREEALAAIRAGAAFHPGATVHVYQSLIIERLLLDVPVSTLRRYAADLLGEQSARLLNREMRDTIERFFACNLNLSETARQLFVHRNTLIYRLEKLEKTTGLDIRRFDDAAVLKLLLLMETGNNPAHPLYPDADSQTK